MNEKYKGWDLKWNITIKCEFLLVLIQKREILHFFSIKINFMKFDRHILNIIERKSCHHLIIKNKRISLFVISKLIIYFKINIWLFYKPLVIIQSWYLIESYFLIVKQMKSLSLIVF